MHVSASLRADAGSLETGGEAAAMECIDPIGIFDQVAAAASEAETEPESAPLPPAKGTAKRKAAATNRPRK